MCCLTILKNQEGEYIFTHNRDENIKRHSNSISITNIKLGQHEVIMPIDKQSNGTWIATSKFTTAALLNGHTTLHVRKDFYNKSRGQVIKNLFYYDNVFEFYNNLDFYSYESFTLLVYQNEEIYEIIWDEVNSSLTKVEIEDALVYSSSTLYSSSIKLERQINFRNFIKENNSEEKILEYHALKGSDHGKYFNVELHNDIQTVSIYQVNCKKAKIKFISLLD